LSSHGDDDWRPGDAASTAGLEETELEWRLELVHRVSRPVAVGDLHAVEAPLFDGSLGDLEGEHTVLHVLVRRLACAQPSLSDWLAVRVEEEYLCTVHDVRIAARGIHEALLPAVPFAADP